MKPNVIIINPDQMRSDCLHHLGNEAAYTPNLDDLSYEGVSFSNAFCQNPVCVPSRCSFMTGLYPHTSGHRTMSNLLKPYEENLFSDMKKAGYYTLSTTRGDLMAGQYKKYHKALIDKYLMFSMSLNTASIPKAQRGEKDSDTFFSFFDGVTPTKKNGKPTKNTDDFSIDAAVREIRHRPKDKPFFMFVGLNFPHPPYAIEQEYYDLIDPDKLQSRIPTVSDTDGKPKMETGLRDALRVGDWDEDRLKEIRRVYLAMCAKVDAQVGRIVNALKKEGIYDDTAIIVMSDHGDYTGDYGIVEKCQNCFPDCLTNVPFIVKPPKTIQADTGINNNLVELTDLCATVYDLCGISCNRQSFSKSTLPTITDKSVPHREFVFTEGGRLEGEEHCSEMNLLANKDDRYAPRQLLQGKEDGTHGKAAMIRNKDYKYVLRLYEKDEFYDLSKGERINLIDEEEYKDVISSMRNEMLLWYMSTCDIVPKEFDDRFTNEFLENNIISVGVPPIVARAFTGAISLTGKTASQFIDAIRKRLDV